MTLKRAKASRRLCSRNKDWSGTGYGSQSSPRVHALPPADHYAEPRKSLEDERHQARGFVVSLNGRVEKMRDAAKMARARAQQMQQLGCMM